MNCPRRISKINNFITCELLPEGMIYAEEYACNICQQQWQNQQPPDSSNLTPRIKSLQKKETFSVTPLALQAGVPRQVQYHILDSGTPFSVETQRQNKPSLINQISSYITSLTKFACDGFNPVSENTYNQRLEICQNCERYNKEKNICSICGCQCKGSNAFVSKLRMPHESCPLQKWGIVTIDTTPHRQIPESGQQHNDASVEA